MNRRPIGELVLGRIYPALALQNFSFIMSKVQANICIYSVNNASNVYTSCDATK